LYIPSEEDVMGRFRSLVSINGVSVLAA